MKRMILAGCFLGFYFHSVSQDSLAMENRPAYEYYKKKGGVDFMIALSVGGALGEMRNAVKNHMGNLGFGLTIQALWDPFKWMGTNGPLRIGADISYNYYGRFISDVTINGYSGSYKTTFGIGRLNGVIRIRPSLNQRFVPFADVFGGGNLYEADTKKNLTLIETALGTETVNFGGKSSIGFNKGIAAGFSWSPDKIMDSYVKLRISCNWGTTINYVVRNSLTYDATQNKLVYQKGSTALNYILIELGIGF